MITLVWTLNKLAILTELPIISKTISTVSDISFLLKFDVAKDFTRSLLITVYHGIFSIATLFVNKNNCLRNVVVSSTQYINMEMI